MVKILARLDYFYHLIALIHTTCFIIKAPSIQQLLKRKLKEKEEENMKELEAAKSVKREETLGALLNGTLKY